MRHEATGQPYRISRQYDVTWKRGAWGFPEKYLLEPAESKPAPLREKQFVPMWKETPQFANCSLYGQGMPQFHSTVNDLQRNDPEKVYADPNNPLLKQLLAERDARRARTAKTTTRNMSSTRGQREGSRNSQHRRPSTSTTAAPRVPPPSSDTLGSGRPTPSATHAAAVEAPAPMDTAMAIRSKQYNIAGSSKVPGVDYQPPAWDAAAAEFRAALWPPQSAVRASHEATATGNPTMRYKLVQSIASQPDKAQAGSGWQTTALSALQREEASVQAKLNLGGGGNRANVPRHGSLRPRDAAASLLRARSKRAWRDVGLVRDLVW